MKTVVLFFISGLYFYIYAKKWLRIVGIQCTKSWLTSFAAQYIIHYKYKLYRQFIKNCFVIFYEILCFSFYIQKTQILAPEAGCMSNSPLFIVKISMSVFLNVVVLVVISDLVIMCVCIICYTSKLDNISYLVMFRWQTTTWYACTNMTNINLFYRNWNIISLSLSCVLL